MLTEFLNSSEGRLGYQMFIALDQRGITPGKKSILDLSSFRLYYSRMVHDLRRYDFGGDEQQNNSSSALLCCRMGNRSLPGYLKKNHFSYFVRINIGVKRNWMVPELRWDVVYLYGCKNTTFECG